MTDFYQVPVRMMQEIKRGADFVTPEGEVIPNARLTRPAVAPKRYAYCSDTAFHPSIIPIIEGVDLLYHEATFAECDAALLGSLRGYGTVKERSRQDISRHDLRRGRYEA